MAAIAEGSVPISALRFSQLLTCLAPVLGIFLPDIHAQVISKFMQPKSKFSPPHNFLCLFACLAFVLASIGLIPAAPSKTEAELLEMLRSSEFRLVNDALDRLPDWYPNSTNAIAAIKDILKTKEMTEKRELVDNGKNLSTITRQIVVSRSENHLPLGLLARRAARALGDYHAKLESGELALVYQLLQSRNEETVMDGLKSIAGLRDSGAIPIILPLLHDENIHVVRDACRTLAVIGNQSNIPAIEPLLKHQRMDVKTDARKAIKALRSKA